MDKQSLLQSLNQQAAFNNLPLDLKCQWRDEHLHVLLLLPNLNSQINWQAVAADTLTNLTALQASYGIRHLSLWYAKTCLVTVDHNPYLLLKPDSPLLSTDLPTPAPVVAQIVQTFIQASPEERRTYLPAIAYYCGLPRSRPPAVAMPDGLGTIQSLSLENKRAVAVWLSRLGRDEAATLAVLQPPEPTLAPAEPGADLEREVMASPLGVILANQLRQQGFTVIAQETAQGIQLRFPETTTAKAAKLATFNALAALDWPNAPTCWLYGLTRDRKISWRAQVSYVPQPQSEQVAFNRFSFDNPRVNLLAIPIAFLIAIVLNFSFFFILMLPWHIWVHEVGHASAAWAAGFRAMPLPFGWTSISNHRHWLVYLGVLFLLGVWFWQGYKERRIWVMVTAVVFAAIQFYMTWLITEDQAFMWISFAGIGGEFYLSTFLLVSFYFPLPDRLRWDIFRFGVIVLAAATLLNSFWQWHLIDVGLSDIPWGSMLGGRGDANGDMNRLRLDYAWTPEQIIASYRRLGEICLLTVGGVYTLFVIRGNPRRWHLLRQRLGLLR